MRFNHGFSFVLLLGTSVLTPSVMAGGRGLLDCDVVVGTVFCAMSLLPSIVGAVAVVPERKSGQDFAVADLDFATVPNKPRREQEENGSSLQEKCRKYCRKATSDCPSVFDFADYPECLSLCFNSTHEANELVNESNFGNTIDCRIHHLDIAFNQKEDGPKEWHCLQARIDSNQADDGSCPNGCICTDECSRNASLRASSDCIVGDRPIKNRPECVDFVLAVTSHLQGPLNGTGVDGTNLDVYDRFAMSILDGNYGGCAQLSAWSNSGCYCEAEKADWIEFYFGKDISEQARVFASGMVPGLCSYEVPPYEMCPELETEPEEEEEAVDVTSCWNAATTASVCNIDAQTQSCCAAIEFMDSLGCFCDSVFEAVKELDPGLTGLRDNLLDQCVPFDSQYSQTRACPKPKFNTDGCSEPPFSRIVETALLGSRVAVVRKFGEILDKYKSVPSFELDQVIEDLSEIVDENAILSPFGLGTFVGIQAFAEYLVLSIPSATDAMWDLEGTYSYGWKVNGSSIGVETQSFNQWYNFTKKRTLFSINEYDFAPCSDKLVSLQVLLDPEFFPLIANSLDYDQWDIDSYCHTIIKFCSDPSLGLQEFNSHAECVAFQSSLPRYSCGPDHPLQGNSASCKFRHAFMLKYRPEYHCPHTGTGLIADENGQFKCTQAECSKPAGELRFMGATPNLLSATPDLFDPSVCVLDEKSTLLLHLSSLGGSSCTMSSQTINEILMDPPAAATSSVFQSFCRPKGNLECEVLRYNLELELSKFDHSCEGQRPSLNSTIASPDVILKEASRLVLFHQLVCLARKGNPEAQVCKACAHEDHDDIVKWSRNQANGLSNLCRRTIHYACSNAHGLAPAFCNACFFLDEEEACSDALDNLWNDQCSEQDSAPSWYELDAAPYESPYPGDEPETDTTDHDLESRKEFDFIIIGAGNAGCVVARRLSDAGHSVLVLEEGIDSQKDKDLWETSRKRRQVLYLWDTPAAKKFNSMPNPALLDRPLDIVTGSALGGTTAINGNLYSRPAQEEFDEFWPTGWKGDDVLPFFKKAEDYQSPIDDPEIHGRNGPLTIQLGESHTLEKTWIQAAALAGVDEVANSATNKSGVYKYPCTFKDGRRQDAFTAYLLPIMPREGLEVRTGARVAKIIHEEINGKRRATGVIYILQGLARVAVFAKREVIVSAGWIGSPRILMLSGIGPRKALEDVEIDVDVELEGVGQQLAARPMQTLAFGGQRIVPENMPWMVTSDDVEREWAVNGSGIFDSPIEAIYGKERSMIDNVTGSSKNDYLMSFSDMLSFDATTPLQTLMSICKVCRPHSKGRVELQSPNPADMPNVYLDFLSDDRDLDILVSCVKKTLSVYKNFRYQGFDLVGWHQMSDEQLRQAIRAQASFSYHAWGTCRMGDGELDVVDPDGLRVRGFSNLRVIDGSIMPEGPCSGPMATTYMIGERGAAFILENMAGIFSPGEHVIDRQAAARAIALSFIVVLTIFVSLHLGSMVRRYELVRSTNKKPLKKRRSSYHNHDNDPLPDADGGTNRRASRIVQVAYSLRNVNEENHEPTQQLRQSSRRRDSATTLFKKGVRRGSALASLTEESSLNIYFSNLSCDVHSGSNFRMPFRSREVKNVRILHNVSGQIKHGTLTVLLGPSGSGKTTLLNILSQRFLSATVNGELLYQLHQEHGAATGANRQVRKFMRRNIAYLRQHPEDCGNLTVYETMVYYYTFTVAPNLADPLKNLSMVDEILTFVGLQEHAHKFASQLSGGQRRRLQIGTSLLDTPLALFLDEPTSGLDGTTSLKIVSLLKQVTEQYGIPVVVTLHRPGFHALTLTDSVFLLARGYGIFQGSYDQLRETVEDREDFQDGEDPVEYVLDYLGFDEDLFKTVFEDHAARFNAEVLPRIRSLTDQEDPNSIVPMDRLKMGSLLWTTTTLLSSFLAFVGTPRALLVWLGNWAEKNAIGLTVTALALLFAIFVKKPLPALLPDDLAAAIGAFLIWASATIAVFHVSVGAALTEGESKHFYVLIHERLMRPVHTVAFWVVQSFLLCLVCIPGFFIFYFALGFRSENVLDAWMIYVLFVLQMAVNAQMIQVAFPGASADAVYGIWATIQIIFCGAAIPLTQLYSWCDWIKYINPTYYVYNALLSLELGVGTTLQCGEACSVLLDSLGYDEADTLITVLVLLSFFILQVILLYLVIFSRSRDMAHSGIVKRVEQDEYGRTELKTNGLMTKRGSQLSLFDRVNVRKLIEGQSEEMRLSKPERMADLQSSKRQSVLSEVSEISEYEW